MTEKLFKFPFISIDDEVDKRRQRLGLTSDEDPDYEMIKGYAEYPFYDFVGIEDGWLPTKESLENAKQGKFDACVVRFANVRMLLCPWTRVEFKEKLKKFAEKLYKEEEEEEKGETRIIHIPLDQLEQIVDKFKEGRDNAKNEGAGESKQ